jgi:hypothetical protein
MLRKFCSNTNRVKNKKKGALAPFFIEKFLYFFKFKMMNWFELFSFQVVNNKYKITYWGENPLEVNISTKLIGLDSIHHTVKYTFKHSGIWFIPNLDYRGCSYISISLVENNLVLFDKLIEKKLSLTAKGQNIICVGLNKTGTTSFTNALENLGYKKFSENQQFQFISPAVYHNDYGKIFSALNNPQYNLFNDKPFSFPKIFKKIFSHRPNDIYVLTVRSSSEKWAESVMNFYNFKSFDNLKNPSHYVHTKFTDNSERFLLDLLIPMIESWNVKTSKDLKTSLVQVYEKHQNECLNFFQDKPNFYIVEIEKKGELKKFTDWLNIKNEELNFPWINKTK